MLVAESGEVLQRAAAAGVGDCGRDAEAALHLLDRDGVAVELDDGAALGRELRHGPVEEGPALVEGLGIVLVRFPPGAAAPGPLLGRRLPAPARVVVVAPALVDGSLALGTRRRAPLGVDAGVR